MIIAKILLMKTNIIIICVFAAIIAFFYFRSPLTRLATKITNKKRQLAANTSRVIKDALDHPSDIPLGVAASIVHPLDFWETYKNEFSKFYGGW